MKYIKLFESEEKPLFIAKAVFTENHGQGYHKFCGYVNKDEDLKLKEFENFMSKIRFKNFGFMTATSLKPIEEHYDIDFVVWLTGFGHLMVYDKDKRFSTVDTYRFDTYTDLLEKYNPYKFEMLPYFIKDSKKEFIIDFFQRLLENKPYSNCWKEADKNAEQNTGEVINYIKTCGVFGAYDALKKYLIPEYKFAKFFKEELGVKSDTVDNLNKLGFKNGG